VDPKDLQHLLAIIATILTLVASFQQAGTAKAKKKTHSGLLREELQISASTPLPPADGHESGLVKMLRDDLDHFAKVGFWWWVVFAGAVSAFAAEGFNWFLDHHPSFVLF
jgi:hypothetical protein